MIDVGVRVVAKIMQCFGRREQFLEASVPTELLEHAHLGLLRGGNNRLNQRVIRHCAALLSVANIEVFTRGLGLRDLFQHQPQYFLAARTMQG